MVSVGLGRFGAGLARDADSRADPTERVARCPVVQNIADNQNDYLKPENLGPHSYIAVSPWSDAQTLR